MRYVAQQHPLGCFIACIAMLFDMDYAQVADLVPLQDDLEQLQRTGVNVVGVQAFDIFAALAESRDLEIADVQKPFACKAESRYLLALSTSDRHINHCVAVDETGTAFDPEDSTSRKHWSEYEPIGMLARTWYLAPTAFA
jgi:hypothetical protein